MNEVEARLGEDHVIYVDGGDSPYNTTLANVSMGNVSVDAPECSRPRCHRARQPRL